MNTLSLNHHSMGSPPMKRLMVSALAKSSGKTSVSVGLARALTRRGLDVAPFKKGPDFIDPLWLTAAARRDCFNLDFNTQSEEEIRKTLCTPADVQLIEGNKGLHDGVSLDGRDSSAALAKLIDAPVLLVANAEGLERGLAAMVAGVRHFDPSVRFAGLILNKLGTLRQADKLRAAITHYTDLPLLGMLFRHEGLARERHLGLVPPQIGRYSSGTIDTMADRIEGGIDIDAILALASDVVMPPVQQSFAQALLESSDITIAVARDEAFSFYYADDLMALQRAGARLTWFDTLHDKTLPPCDGLFIGGGFPECAAPALAANQPLRDTIRLAIQSGLPTYAECGGLMYMSRSILIDGQAYPMCGVLDMDMVMEERPVGRGLVELSENGASPWPAAGTGRHLRAHEFHHARAVNIGPDIGFAWRVERGHGITGREDGAISARMLAGFAHLRSTEAHRWTDRFIALIRNVRRSVWQKAS